MTTYTLQTDVVKRGAVTVPELMMLRKMSPVVADKWLRTNKPDIDPSELEDLVSAVQSVYTPPITAPQRDRFPERPKFVAAAWLVGASWGQLSILFGVTRETLIRSCQRHLPPGDRQGYRLMSKIPYNRLAFMRDEFVSLMQKNLEIDSLTAYDLATMLSAISETDSSEYQANDPYAEQ